MFIFNLGGKTLGKKRIESLDSLRGIAAFVVIIFHCLLSFHIFYDANYNFEFDNWLVELFTVTPLHTLWAGKEAVLLFFVSSGFVLMTTVVFLGKIIPIWLAFVLVPIISILVGHLTYKWIEVPAMNIGRSAAEKVDSIRTNKAA